MSRDIGDIDEKTSGFSFAGTIYLYKVVSGKQKYVDCYPTNGSGIAFTGISGQIDTHVRKGT